MSFGVGTVAFGGSVEPAVIHDNRVLQLSLLVPPAPRSVREMFTDWARWQEAIGEALSTHARTASLPIAEATFLPPVPDPPTIYCIGANYADHAREMDDAPKQNGAVPYHFLVPAGTLVGHRQRVMRPSSVTMLDWEVELAVVIGRQARHVSEADALECIAGYTVANDISARDPELVRDATFGVRWMAMKAFETFLPMGPAIVPSSFVDDPMNLNLSLSVNGEVRQESNTRLMITSIQEQIAYLSNIVSLQPGDVLLTGTPAGTAAAHSSFLRPGDRVSATVEGLGTLENVVADAVDGGTKSLQAGA